MQQKPLHTTSWKGFMMYRHNATVGGRECEEGTTLDLTSLEASAV